MTWERCKHASPRWLILCSLIGLVFLFPLLLTTLITLQKKPLPYLLANSLPFSLLWCTHDNSCKVTPNTLLKSSLPWGEGASETRWQWTRVRWVHQQRQKEWREGGTRALLCFTPAPCPLSHTQLLPKPLCWGSLLPPPSLRLWRQAPLLGPGKEEAIVVASFFSQTFSFSSPKSGAGTNSPSLLLNCKGSFLLLGMTNSE